MWPQRRAKGRVVVEKVFAHRRQWQVDGGFLRCGQAGEQRQLWFDSGDGPARSMAMAGQAAEGAGIGELLARTRFELGAKAQVMDICEWLALACGFDTLGIGFPKAAHHP